MGGREETLRSLGHWSIKVLITQWCGVVLCESWLGRGGGEGEGLCKIQTCQLQARGCDLHIFNEGVRGIQSLMLSQWPYVSPSLPKEGKGTRIVSGTGTRLYICHGEIGRGQKKARVSSEQDGTNFTLLFHQNKIPQCPSNNDGGLAIQ